MIRDLNACTEEIVESPIVKLVESEAEQRDLLAQSPRFGLAPIDNRLVFAGLTEGNRIGLLRGAVIEDVLVAAVGQERQLADFAKERLSERVLLTATEATHDGESSEYSDALFAIRRARSTQTDGN